MHKKYFIISLLIININISFAQYENNVDPSWYSGILDWFTEMFYDYDAENPSTPSSSDSSDDNSTPSVSTPSNCKLTSGNVDGFDVKDCELFQIEEAKTVKQTLTKSLEKYFKISFANKSGGCPASKKFEIEFSSDYEKEFDFNPICEFTEEYKDIIRALMLVSYGFLGVMIIIKS